MAQREHNEMQKLALMLQSASHQLKHAEHLTYTDEVAWYLLILPIIGELHQKLEEIEATVIADAAAAGTDPQRIAHHLHMSPVTVYRRIKSAEISRQEEPNL